VPATHTFRYIPAKYPECGRSPLADAPQHVGGWVMMYLRGADEVRIPVRIPY